jgi:seryl-tRNA synthetase
VLSLTPRYVHVPCVRAEEKDDNPILRVWHPEPNHKGNTEPGLQVEDKTEGIISHHEVLTRLEAFDMERGQLNHTSCTRVADSQVSKSPATEVIS